MEMNDEARFDKAMKLSAKTGVSLEDAKAALNACNYDMLDAVVYLEELGKVKAPVRESYTTSSADKKRERVYDEDDMEPKTKKVNFGDLVARLFRWLGKVIRIGNENFLDLDKEGETIIRLPLTVCVILLFFMFWVCVPLLFIGLFFGIRYGFSGPLFRKDDVFNSTMNKASDMAENIKNEVNRDNE